MAISKTAFGVAYQRFAHVLFEEKSLILDDYLVEHLLSQQTKTRIRESKDKMLDVKSLGLRSNVVTRSRYAEDWIRMQIEDGSTYVVMLGAGLDTCALRMGVEIPTVQFFKLDERETQSQKLSMIKSGGLEVPHNVHFVPVNF
jgi:methyltransferase (TIGR00027 family)